MAKYIDSLVVRNELITHEEGLSVKYYESKDTTEAAHDALCAMGWTPPEEKNPITEALQGCTIKIFTGKIPEFPGEPDTSPTPPVNKTIHEAFRTLTHAVHANAVEHGWFDTEMPNKEMEFLIGMAGVMKECGEALEVVSAKEWDVMDEKCPQHTKLVVELADVVLRLLTLCGRHDLNIGAAITAKHEFNRSRPYRHGGKAF